MKKLLAAALVLVFLLAGAAAAHPARFEDELIGNVITGINAPYMEEGGVPSRTDFFTEERFADNLVTVVNYWDSGCINCRLEMPSLNELHRNYSGMGVSVLGAATRRIGGSFEYGWELLCEMGIIYPCVIADEGFVNAAGDYYVVPLTLLVGPDGRILDARAGRMDYEEMELRALRLIAVPGDADGSGAVDSADVSALAAFLIDAGELSPMGRAAADMDRDLEIGAKDMKALYELFGMETAEEH